MNTKLVKDESETKKKLLESAQKEFTEKGFSKASLRTICKNAGVTTGALYFFFQDKDALFSAVVEEPLEKLKQLLTEHLMEDEQIMSSDDWVHAHKDLHEQMNGDLELSIVHHLYSYYDIYMLLLTKAQGSAYESCADEMVDMLERGYQNIISTMVKKNQNLKANEYMMHWMAHMNIDAFVHLLTHEKDEQKALAHMGQILQFIMSCWAQLIN